MISPIGFRDAPWFVAADVCRVLEIVNSRHATSRLDDDERAAVVIDDASLTGNTQRRSITVINESGLYSLIMTSRVPSANGVATALNFRDAANATRGLDPRDRAGTHIVSVSRTGIAQKRLDADERDYVGIPDAMGRQLSRNPIDL